jgi:hypothetical protein
MNLEASHLDQAEPDQAMRGGRAAGMKFTYPSGSRPLEGYTLKRGVGRGGFGEVYFATSDAGKEVALKLIRRNLDVELRGVRQCLNLKHPNLIGLFDIRGDDLDDQWVVMEYVSGESLEDVIDRYPDGVPEDQVLWWMRGMCAGVAYLHDHGIVHRDLKPGNVFSDEGTVKIGDYGLAKFISCSRRSGQTESVGTVHYMAPEIANGRYGREIDTYALGIMLYEMLTGHVPFEGESVGEVLMKHLTAEPDLSRLEEPYRDIVRRTLAKDPDQRLKSVGEMVALLPGEGTVPSAPPAVVPAAHQEAAEAQHAGPGAAAAGGLPPWHEPTPEVIEEPIWKAIREGAASLRGKWNSDDVQQLNPLMKALLIFAFVVLCVWAADLALALAIPAAVCYGVYYLIWASVIRPSMSRHAKQHARGKVASRNAASHVEAATADWRSTEQPMSPAARYAHQVRRRRLRPSWRERASVTLAAKPLRDKLTELSGSMLLAALFASLAALVAPLLLAEQAASENVAIYLWLTIVGTLGSWAILVPTKFVEGKIEDQVPMRFVLLLLGAAVGLAAWLLGDVLLLKVASWGEPVDLDVGLLSQEALNWSRPANAANPSLSHYVAYFAFLFLVLRWWRQAEFTRNSRLSLWTVFVCVGWAWLLNMFWWFPQPTGMMAAGVIAFATQMSSPWLPPSGRRVFQEEAEQAV